MLGKPVNNALPDFESEKTLCDEFASFFVSKVQKIRCGITSDTFSASSLMDSDYCGSSSFSSFSNVNEDELLQIMSSLTNKHCELDIIPTTVFKNCIQSFLPYVLHIVNTSLSSGDFPTAFKSSLVRPILKNPSLDRNTLANYRPISNMCFLSKVIEKCVLKQLLAYLEKNNLFCAV